MTLTYSLIFSSDCLFLLHTLRLTQNGLVTHQVINTALTYTSSKSSSSICQSHSLVDLILTPLLPRSTHVPTTSLAFTHIPIYIIRDKTCSRHFSFLAFNQQTRTRLAVSGLVTLSIRLSARRTL